MALLQYTVWEGANEVALGLVVNENVITIDGTSGQSPTVIDPNAPGTRSHRRVRLTADTDCWVTWGANPTALNDGTAGRMLGSGPNPEYFHLEAGWLIAVIERV